LATDRKQLIRKGNRKRGGGGIKTNKVKKGGRRKNWALRVCIEKPLFSRVQEDF